MSVVRSLDMVVYRLPDGRWAVLAEWLTDPVVAQTWPEAYWLAIRERTEEWR